MRNDITDPSGPTELPTGGSSPGAGGRLHPNGAARRFTSLLLISFSLWSLALVFLLPRDLVINGLLDDSYYYLQVARNIAAGLGSTFDGVEKTNGYHPLWMLLLVPLAKLLAGHPDALVRGGLLLGAALGVGSILLTRSILYRSAGGWAAAVGMLLFAWPRFFGQTLNLLETSLLLFLYLALAWTLSAPRGTDASLVSGRRMLWVGLLLGLSALARLDTLFLLIAYGICGLIHRRWMMFWALAIMTVLVLPYLAVNLALFGHLQPVSGAAKSGFPVPELRLDPLRWYPDFTLLLVLGAGFFLASLRRGASALLRVLGLFGLAGILHMGYTLFFMRWGVDRWHFVLLMPTGLLGIPWLAHQALGRFSWGRSRGLGWVILTLGLLAAVIVQGTSLKARAGRHLAEVRETALWARENLPEDSVFGMTDAGVFAYYSGRTTINLDGLINSYDYLEALRTGSVIEYLDRREVDYLFDQSAYGVPEWLNGTYEERILRVWYRPESRVGAEIRVQRDEEVYRRNLLSRRYPLNPPEPNALILYRYRPERQ